MPGISGNRNIRGIVFDLDGVLFDTEPLHRDAWNHALDEMGIDISPEELMAWTGVPCQQISAELEEKHHGRYSREEYYRMKEQYFLDIITSRDALFDGLAESLERLSEYVPLTVATSSSRKIAEILLERSGIAGFFKTSICYDDVGRHKPDPEPYLKAAAHIDVKASECIALDDSPSGCSSARSAGMYTIGITSSFPREELGTVHAVFFSTREACLNISDALGTPGGKSVLQYE